MINRMTLAAAATLTLAACADEPVPTEPRAPAAASFDRDATATASTGAVYSMSNSRNGNSIVAFRRHADGTLTRIGRFFTAGRGSGSFEDSAHGLILGSTRGESAPNNLIAATDFLFATNAGSNTISVFRVKRDGGLELAAVQRSGGEKPVSVTVNRGILYVLNSGEFVDDLIDAAGNVIPNCTTGNLPSVTGFRVTSRGGLIAIPSSTRQLSGDSFSGCAQLSFTPDGRHLVVTERTAVSPPEVNDRLPAGDEGLINTFAVNQDGTLGEHRVIDATGQGPFGFTFTKPGTLITTEQFDGLMGPGLGAAASYAVNADGTLTSTSPSVNNGGTDTCWFVVTDDGEFGFATSFFGAGQISSYGVGPGGALTLLDATADDGAAGQGASDISLSRSSEYLDQLNSFEGKIYAYHVGNGGGLTLVQSVQAHAPSLMAAPVGMAAY